jgi:hypothetical protein
MSSLPYTYEPLGNDEFGAKARRKRSVRLHITLLSIVALALLALSGQLPLPSLPSLDKVASFFASPFASPCHNMTTDMTHDASGWHARSEEYTGEFAPTKETLVLTTLLNTRVEPEGFTLALIRPNIAVDARGKVLNVPQADFDAIASLATAAVTALPRPETFRGQWRIQHDRTGYDIDRLLVTGHEEISIYGFDGTTLALAEPVAGRTELPEQLNKIFGWITEGKEGYIIGQKDDGPIDKVLVLLTEEVNNA